MRMLLCSSGIAFLLMSGAGTLADETPAARNAQTATVQSPPAPSAPGQAALTAPERATATAAGPATTVTKADDSAPAKPSGQGDQTAPSAPPDPLLFKLKAQIKTVRLALAETSGRLTVTEKNLVAATADIDHLRGENTALRTGLTRAETASKKTEEELAARRQEMRDLSAQRSPDAAGTFPTGLVLSLAVSLVLALAVLGQGKRLSKLAARLPADPADQKPGQERDDPRHEQLRTQLKDEQQKAQRLEEQLRQASNRTADEPGSKGGKLESIRRELRDLRAEAGRLQKDQKEQKRTAEARIQALEAEVEKLSTANQKLDQALAKANEKLIFLGHDDPEDTTAPNVD